jgi:hypothetical protein
VTPHSDLESFVSDFVSPPPPPPAASGAVATKPNQAGWLAVAAGVLGVLALVLPWYSPKLSKPINGVSDLGSKYHAWSGFFFLVIAPVLLILFAVLWLQALRGRPNSRFAGAENPNRALALQSIIAGLAALVLGLLSIVLMSHHYKDWDAASKEAKSLGSSLEKNPQLGFYALMIGGVFLLGAGIIGLVLNAAKPDAGSAQGGYGSAPGTDQVQGGFGNAPGAGPVQGGYGTAPGGYPPAGQSQN